jgi:hypothetical protein
VVCDWGCETMIIYPKNVVCESYVWREGGDESGQTRLLTKEIGLSQFRAIELHLWVINRDWVMTDPIGQ